MNFIDLIAQRRRIGDQIDAADSNVLDGGRYVLGPEVRELEDKLAAYCGASRTITCANGTDALALLLMAWDIRPGDAVFVPSFTFVATAQVVPWLGAAPIFVDVRPDTYTMDPASLEAAIAKVKSEGLLNPKVVIAVDLFGQPADYPAISEIAQRSGLKLIADTAQGFGCTLNGRHPVSWADAATTSFYPAKPLGCYGDGGAVLTRDETLADLAASLCIYGKALPGEQAPEMVGHDPKYLSFRIGMNSRLDTLQAAILLEKLKVFDAELKMRDQVATRYIDGLEGVVDRTPCVIDGGTSTWAQFTIEHHNRDELGRALKEKGVPTAVYYPVPLHAHPFAQRYRGHQPSLPVTERLCERVISLPMHPDLSAEDQARVIDAVKTFSDE